MDTHVHPPPLWLTRVSPDVLEKLEVSWIVAVVLASMLILLEVSEVNPLPALVAAPLPRVRGLWNTAIPLLDVAAMNPHRRFVPLLDSPLPGRLVSTDGLTLAGFRPLRRS